MSTAATLEASSEDDSNTWHVTRRLVPFRLQTSRKVVFFFTRE